MRRSTSVTALMITSILATSQPGIAANEKCSMQIRDLDSRYFQTYEFEKMTYFEARNGHNSYPFSMFLRQDHVDRGKKSVAVYDDTSNTRHSVEIDAIGNIYDHNLYIHDEGLRALQRAHGHTWQHVYPQHAMQLRGLLRTKKISDWNRRLTDDTFDALMTSTGAFSSITNVTPLLARYFGVTVRRFEIRPDRVRRGGGASTGYIIDIEYPVPGGVRERRRRIVTEAEYQSSFASDLNTMSAAARNVSAGALAGISSYAIGKSTTSPSGADVAAGLGAAFLGAGCLAASTYNNARDNYNNVLRRSFGNGLEWVHRTRSGSDSWIDVFVDGDDLIRYMLEAGLNEGLGDLIRDNSARF